MDKKDYEVNNIAEDVVKKIRILETHYLLNEASFARVVTEYFDYGFIIISANRSCEAEKGSVCDEKEINLQNQKNKANEASIRKDITKAGFGFIPSYGGYKEKYVDDEGNQREVDSPTPEPSFIIPSIRVATNERRKDYQSLRELGISLSQKYNQDAFLYKPPNEVDKNAYYVDKSGNVAMTFSDVKPNDLAQQYYTQMRKMNPNKRFTLAENLYFIPKGPYCLSEAIKRYGEIFFRMIGQEDLQVQKVYGEREAKEKVRKEKKQR